MNKHDLERMVAGVKAPPLDRKQTRLLIDDNINEFQKNQPNSKQVVQSLIPRAAQGSRVAQDKPQQVAQAVAQGSWVAQKAPQTVAQDKPQQVAQTVPQQKIQHNQKTQADKDVDRLKEQIYQIETIEARKKFVLSIGFGIVSEKRGGTKSYLYGIKKIDGKKYRLYIGNSTKI